MLVNYHTHTARCNHAKGTEAEYVECALAGGLEVLGFSDHSPYLFDGDHYSWFRMKPHELAEYVDTIKKLQKSYAGQIELPIGLEVEYYPNLFAKLLPFLNSAVIVQYSCGTNLWISRSLSQIIFRAADCTRPAERPFFTFLQRSGLIW